MKFLAGNGVFGGLWGFWWVVGFLVGCFWVWLSDFGHTLACFVWRGMVVIF